MHSLSLVFDQLKHSRFRSRFRLSAAEYRYLQKLGPDTLLLHAEQFIASRLAPPVPLNDGKQTPFHGHPVFVAQHATATCCRSCLHRSHGIPTGMALTHVQQQYVVAAVMHWLLQQPAPAFKSVSVSPAQASLF